MQQTRIFRAGSDRSNAEWETARLCRAVVMRIVAAAFGE